MDLTKNFKPAGRTMLASAVLFCISVLCLGRNSVFIYFNF